MHHITLHHNSFFMFQMVSHYPPNIPSSVPSPLLTEKALQLLGNVVTPNEDQLWGSLGDAWNIPRSSVPEYIYEITYLISKDKQKLMILI